MAVDSAQIGIMLGVFLVLISVFFVRKPLPVSAMSAFPACWAGTSSEQVPLKVIAIGDVHGNLGALLETLHQAEIIALNSAGSPMCQWKDNLLQTAKHELLLVQTGDIVDRGPDAPECWQCLKHLQDTAPAGVNVVR
jgi:hypothetical protein